MRITLVSSLLVAAAFVLGCDADKDRVTDTDGQQSFQSLAQREHVLNNLELAYNERRISEFSKLLDSEFTFFFSPGDVGGNIPDQWGRVEELQMATLLFDPTLDQPPYPICRSIRMDLKFEAGVTWTDTVPPAHPTETWYTTPVYYEFTFEMKPDFTFIAVPGSQAQFTVRNAGTDDEPQWRLVEWRDVAGSSLATLGTTATESTTWGGVKALYR